MQTDYPEANMDYDDNVNRCRVNVKMTAWKDKTGEAQLDVTCENFVKGMFKSENEKSGKVLENIDTTTEEAFDALDRATKKANERGIKCSHQTMEAFEDTQQTLLDNGKLTEEVRER